MTVKTQYTLILITILLAACSAGPTDSTALTAISETHIFLPIKTKTPISTGTATQPPTPSITPSLPATIPPTMTASPTFSSTPVTTTDCLPIGNLAQKGIVTEVIDGDTIIVRLEDGYAYSVRYIGIDAPERTEQFFTESYNANADLVLQKEVTLIKDVSETDQYDRLLRYVLVDDIFVNLELVRAGFAIAAQYPPDIACADTFSSAEYATRASQIGIWEATPSPEPSAGQVIILTVNKREEYVDIQNVGAADVDLAGWKLVSERGDQECHLSGVITPGETLRIWAGTAQGSGYSCGYGSPIWNNSEVDPAVLYNAQGVEVSRK